MLNTNFATEAAARVAKLPRDIRAQYVQVIAPTPGSLRYTDVFTPTVIGIAEKVPAHTPWTAMHWAFSVHIQDESGAILIQQRAVSKRTWGGVWSGSCCGHVVYGETPEESMYRRMEHELGIPKERCTFCRLALPGYVYGCVTEDGAITEHELCPVFIATVSSRDVAPNPEEVMATAWIPVDELLHRVQEQPESLSPWTVEQLQLLRENEAI